MSFEEQTPLRVALLHSSPVHGDVAANLEWILDAANRAADAGARLIVTAEMALSGYGFDGPEQVRPHARTPDCPEVLALRRLSARRGVYCVLGLPEHDPRTGLLYNTVLATDPHGEVVAKHRKVVLAERRWATPGPPRSEGLFDTPWGRVGMLICADTYYGTPARAQVLRGADMLVVPSTWPGGGVDPRLVWRARALENGVPVLGCNRTGRDAVLDCTRTRSYAVDGRGRVLLDRSSAEGTVLFVDLPVLRSRPEETAQTRTQNRLSARPDGARSAQAVPSGHGNDLLNSRRPEYWRALGLQTDGPHPEYLWGNPPADLVHVRAGDPAHECPGTNGSTQDEHLNRTLIEIFPVVPDLHPAPQGPRVLISRDSQGPFLASAGTQQWLGDRPVLHSTLCGVRVAVATPEYVAHPESVAALAREGCDLVAVLADSLQHRQRAMLATRCLERVPIAVVTPGNAGVYVPPEGHEPWHSVVRRTPGTVQLDLDVAVLRDRRLFDRLDLEVLCAQSNT